MDLINHTPYPSIMFRTGVDENKIAASIGVRITYNVNQAVVSAAEKQEWILNNDPTESEFGPMESDNVFRRGGVDLFVFGKAKAPYGAETKSMEVIVSVKNKVSHKMIVSGNRHWEKGVFGMNISEAEPFLEMPLTLSNAFGGKAEWDGIEIPYGNNPYGKGYYWEKQNALDKPLPNIEHPENLVSSWNNRPDPIGVVQCPMNELRARDNLKYTDKGELTEIKPRFFNSAFPTMIADIISPGEKIIIEGMTISKPYVFQVPESKLKIKVSVGDKTNTYNLLIEQIGILPDKEQAFITYRFPFRYTLREFEKRKCEIFE